MIIKTHGNNAEINVVDRACLKNVDIAKNLGWNHNIDLEDGLADVINNYS